MSQHRRVGFAVLCAGLTTMLAAEISLGALRPDGPDVPVSGTSASMDMPRLPDIDSMVSDILERPLFSASRSPSEAQVEIAEEEDTEEADTFQSRLTGVMITPNGREALFEREGSKPVAVKEGARIDGWMVKEIRLDQVVLHNALGDEVLKPTSAPPHVRHPQQRVAGIGASGPNPSATATVPALRAPQRGSSQARK